MSYFLLSEFMVCKQYLLRLVFTGGEVGSRALIQSNFIVIKQIPRWHKWNKPNMKIGNLASLMDKNRPDIILILLSINATTCVLQRVCASKEGVERTFI